MTTYDHDDHEDPRIFGLNLGFVADNADPKGLGRVRVRIPGLIEPASNWAFPLGFGGAPQQGGFDVPPKGATVGVLFLQGDPDHPYYMAAVYGEPNGESEAPTPIKDPGLDKADAHLVKAYESTKFLVTIDNRDGNEVLEMRHKASGDRIAVDGSTPGIYIKGSAAVVIESDGMIALRAPRIQINKRVIRAVGKPI